MSLPIVKPQGGTPTSTDFTILQTRWAQILNPLIALFNSEPDFIGEVRGWAAGAAPSKFLITSAQVLLQSEYSELFGAIGTTYNVGGEPAGHFRLPPATTPVPSIIRYKR